MDRWPRYDHRWCRRRQRQVRLGEECQAFPTDERPVRRLSWTQILRHFRSYHLRDPSPGRDFKGYGPGYESFCRTTIPAGPGNIESKVRKARIQCNEIGAVVGEERERCLGELPRTGKSSVISVGEEVFASRGRRCLVLWCQGWRGSRKSGCGWFQDDFESRKVRLGKSPLRCVRH